MRAGFHSIGLYKDSASVLIEKSRRAGYLGVELGAETVPWTGPLVTPMTSQAERHEMVAAAAAAGLDIIAVGAHIPMIFNDADKRRAAINYVNGCTTLAREVGCPVVHILSGPLPTDVSNKEGWRWFADAVAETTTEAQSQGIALGIEAVFGNMFRSTADYLALRRDLPGVPYGINYDPSHLVVHGDDPIRLIAEAGDQIIHVHMKDGAGRYPEFSFPPLGKGEIDFERVVRELRAQGYSDWLSVEYEAQVFGYKETEAEVLEHGRAFLRRLGV
jgi:sugar phosphate isomerase/epimerase